MQYLHRFARSLAVAGAALVLIVGVAFAAHGGSVANDKPTVVANEAPTPATTPTPTPTPIAGAANAAQCGVNDQQGDVEDQAGDANDQGCDVEDQAGDANDEQGDTQDQSGDANDQEGGGSD